MIRNILSVIVGYAIFVITSLLLFRISGQKPHADTSTFFIVGTMIYGAVFSFIAGLVTQYLSRSSSIKINYVLAIIIAGFSMFSLLKTSGNHWSQLLAVFVFAPVSILGGLFYKIK
jgi:RsiW-degrading membrane proteinase PrsW (M82 family)